MGENTTELTQWSLSDIGNVLSSASIFYFYKVENKFTNNMRYICEFIEIIQTENLVITVVSLCTI